MSLINEALQRARDEATRREAARKGLPLAPSLRSRQKSPLMMLIVFVLAAALTISLLVLARTAGSLSPLPGPDTTRISEDTAVGTTTPAPVPTETEHAAPVTDEPHAAEVAQPGAEARVQAGNGSSSEPSPSTAPSTVSVESSDPASSGTGSKPRAGTRTGQSAGDPRVFVSLATLSDGSSIDLGGIAWSETGPYALLNGKVVGIGESIEGYLVTEITPTQVSFEKFDERIVLRLK